jgi:hypothetical protein
VLKGNATIEVLLTNASRQPIFVYSDLDWGESASLSIWLKDVTTGEDVSEKNFLHDSITPPPSSQDDFVKILPGHIYGVSIRSSIRDLNIRRKGTYEIVAEYHSPIPPSLSFGLPIWSTNEATLRSNRVTITVGE